MSVEIIEGKGGLPTVHVKNSAAEADIALHGAHITSFIPANGTQLLWLSPESIFKVGTPIRGGIPVCWPWFSKNPTNPDLPMHGFARISVWKMTAQKELSDSATQITLTLADTPETHKLWDFDFKLQAVFTVADTLSLELVTENTGDKPFTITQALHTYFNVGDIKDVTVLGLDNLTFFDKVAGKDGNLMAPGPFAISQEVDRVYHHAPGPFQIADEALGRTITITSQGSDSAVTWNPWINKAAAMKDFPDDGYRNMVCVETCNAGTDTRTVQPGDTHAIRAVYAISR